MAIFSRSVLMFGLFCGVDSAPDMSSKENLGIVVHYKVKVRLILGFGHRSVSAPASLQQIGLYAAYFLTVVASSAALLPPNLVTVAPSSINYGHMSYM